AEARKLAAALQPALSVVDARLGLAVVRDIRAASPTTAILVLSASLGNDPVVEAFAAGALGYALATQRGAEVIAALRIIRSGQRYLAPGLAAPELEVHGPGRRATRDGLLDG